MYAYKYVGCVVNSKIIFRVELFCVLCRFDILYRSLYVSFDVRVQYCICRVTDSKCLNTTLTLLNLSDPYSVAMTKLQTFVS